MPSVPHVLIDTGAIYAFVVRNDIHHNEAVEYMRFRLAQRGDFYLLDIVFAECMTLFKIRLGAAIAIQAGIELRRNPMYAWLISGAGEQDRIWRIFEKYKDKTWSYTDCALFAAAQQNQVREIFAFDRHFDQMPGLKRVP